MGKFKKFINRILDLDIIIIYTVLALAAKSAILDGFILDQNHMRPRMTMAHYLLTVHPFRILYLLGFLLVPISLALLLKNRVRLYVLLTINVLFSVSFLIDLWYLRGFNTLPTLHIMQMRSNLDNTFSSIMSVVHTIDIVFIIDIPLLTLFIIVTSIFKKDFYRKIRWNPIVFAVVITLSILTVKFFAPLVNNYTSKMPMAWIYYKFDSVSTACNISPIGYDIYSAYSYLNEKKDINLTADDINLIKEWYQTKNENLPDNKFKGLFNGENLIIMQVESLENFVINKKIDGQEITPNLNKLLSNSLYFTGVNEQVAQGNSSDADLMTNTSVYPVSDSTTFFTHPFTDYNSLPKLFKKLGYSTFAIHPDNGAFWNWMPALSHMGFDKCFDSSCYKMTEKINMGISDESYFKQIEPIIVKQKKPFYDFVVTLSSHTPFELTPNHRYLKLSQSLDKSKIGDYFQCIRYTDTQIGMLLGMLQKEGILDHTTVVIYGDHEGLHKYFPQDVNGYTPSEGWWKDNHKHVPLIIYNRKLSSQVLNITGGQIDIYPTVAYLMGINEYQYQNTAMGRNLLKTNKSFAVLRNGNVVGENLTEKDKTSARNGLKVADLIIKGNYFRGMKLN